MAKNTIRFPIGNVATPRKIGINGFNKITAAGNCVKKNRPYRSALMSGNRYGTSRGDLNRLVEAGTDVMVEIDVQGARQLKANLKEAVFIFILPPSPEACKLRLKGRGQDTDEVIEKRCAAALSEIKEAGAYDYIIINDDLNEAFSDFSAVIMARRVTKEKVIGKVVETFDI